MRHSLTALVLVLLLPIMLIPFMTSHVAARDSQRVIWSVTSKAIFNQTYLPPIVVAPDLDNDGSPDVAIGFKDGHIRVFGGLSGSTLADISIAGTPIITMALMDDVNGDGKVEVLALSSDSILRCVDLANRRVLWSIGVHGAEDSFTVYPRDINGDGVKDVMVAQGSALKVVSGADGSILKTEPKNSLGVTVIRDVNGNGWKDVAVRESKSIRVIDPYSLAEVWRSSSTYAETRFIMSLGPGDSYIALIDASIGGYIYIYDTSNWRMWTRVRGSVPGSVIDVGDIDGDGINDLLVTFVGISTDNVFLYRSPNKPFMWKRAIGNGLPRASVLRDCTGDGIDEVLLISPEGGVFMLNPRTGATVVSYGQFNGVPLGGIALNSNIGVAILTGSSSTIIGIDIKVADSTPPVIISFSPGMNEGVSTTPVFKVVAEDPESGLSSAIFIIDDVEYKANFDYNNTFNLTVYLGEGMHTWSAKVWNNVGLYSEIGPVKMFIDKTPPIIVDLSPKSDDIVGVNITFYVKARDVGSGVAKIEARVIYGTVQGEWVELSQVSNDTWSGNYTLNREYSGQAVYWQARVVDHANLAVTSSLIALNVDWTPPRIADVYLWPKIVMEGGEVRIYCKASDSETGIEKVEARYTIGNQSRTIELSPQGGDVYMTSISPVPPGDLVARVYIRDGAGNVAVSPVLSTHIYMTPNYRIEALEIFKGEEKVSDAEVGETVKVKITVVAEGDYFPQGANITLYINGKEVRGWFIMPAAGEKRVLTYVWSSKQPGTYNVKAVLTSGLDKNPNDNTAIIQFKWRVRPLQTERPSDMLTWFALGAVLAAVIFAATYIYISRRKKPSSGE